MKRRQWLNVVGLGLLILSMVVAITGCGGEKSAESASAGPEPNFTTDSSYIHIDKLKEAYDQGANMIIVDARPKQDYDLDHIKGAISMPFFEVEQRYKELPRDTWIVTYCACPRAEAEEAAKILRDKGYEKVKVFYEGYFEWLGRHYPTTKDQS